MRFPYRSSLLLASLCLLLPGARASENHWSYQGDQGPAHWAGLGSPVCGTGQSQSPIDLDMHRLTPRPLHPDDLHIAYGKQALQVINNGHTIQASPAGDEGLTYKGQAYSLAQFHFHTPSEHLIDHHHYPLEMHLVNRAPDGHLLVLAAMIKRGRENPELAGLWNALPQSGASETHLDAGQAPDLARLLPTGGHHLFYTGSLTTPPCSEGVQWVIFEQPLEMSTAQIGRFRQLFPDNHRPAQPLDGREVDED
ncbi:carbonic anhydrase [Pseudomonas citronellolis]|uniref:carbonic anhydrase n=1 Tax=Pseudomonas citronellolis TaxID=53408 RepID=UPI0023E4345F|nr:carbonic anhydrase family protein [Pseudomonas citronellolis]MDF3932289.1 carbonic anhydrase family protein [Pseudomonas citronellolis]